MRLGIIGVLLYGSGAFAVIVVGLSIWMESKRDRDAQRVPVEAES